MVPFSSYVPLSISDPSVAIKGTTAVNSGSSYCFNFTLKEEYEKGNSIRFTFQDVLSFNIFNFLKGYFSNQPTCNVFGLVG